MKQLPKNTALTGQLKWVERIASVMDDKFRFPGTNFRFGLDPILNFIPLCRRCFGLCGISCAPLCNCKKWGREQESIDFNDG